MTTYMRMNKQINKLEETTNSVDYPEELMNNKKWTLGYIDKLYEYSVNGARSPKAISYLRKVNNTVHAIIGSSVVLVALVIIGVTLLGRK